MMDRLVGYDDGSIRALKVMHYFVNIGRNKQVDA